MEQLIDAIRAATAPEATDDIKTAGANACRALLAALEAKPGQPLAGPTPGPTAGLPSAPAIDTAQLVAQFAGALRGMPAEQLLDLAIDRLRRALPASTSAPTVAPIKFQLIPVPAMPPKARP